MSFPWQKHKPTPIDVEAWKESLQILLDRSVELVHGPTFIWAKVNHAKRYVDDQLTEYYKEILT